MALVANRFLLLDDEPEAPRPQSNQAAKPAGSNNATGSKSASGSSSSASVGSSGSSGNAGANNRGGRGGNRPQGQGRGGYSGSNDSYGSFDGNFEGRSSSRGGASRGSRGGRGGRDNNGPRPPRAEGSEGSGERRPRREFERHSGSNKTGIKAEEKRHGGGAFNWGTEDDGRPRRNFNRRERQPRGDDAAPSTPEGETPAAAEGDAAAPAEGSAEGSAEGAAASASADGDAQSADKKSEDDGPKLLSLEEYRKQLSAAAPKVALPAPRKAGEDVDNSQWKNTSVLKKEEAETDIFYLGADGKGASSQAHSESGSSRGGSKKQVLDVGFRFNEPARDSRDSRGDRGDRGDRSDRGGRDFRGGRGGSSNRGGNNQRFGRGGDRAPNVNDESAFPSLK